jgi:hypothetical protein
MAQQFLKKKKFSFRGLFLRFFAIVILLYFFTTSVFAATDSMTSGINSLSDFYKHITTLPKNNSPKVSTEKNNSKIPSPVKFTSGTTSIAGKATAIAGQVKSKRY